MILLNIKSTTWAYALISLGTEMSNSVFSFYYVKLFLELYKISELSFYQSQVILMICNVLNNLTGYFHMNSQSECSLCRHCYLYGALLHAVAFLLPWFPWRYYQEGDWLSGLQLVVSLCAFDSTLTWVQQAQCRMLAETFPRHESRLQWIRINQLASLAGSTSILFCGLFSHNMEILPNFQTITIIIAFLTAASLYMGMSSMRRCNSKRSPEENFLSESEQKRAWTSVILLMRQVLSQRNFYLFLVMNFFQVFQLTFINNCMMIFTDNLVPRKALSSSIQRIMCGASFICPHYLVLLGQSWLKTCGYYKIISISFYLEGAAAIVMLFLGQEHYYCLAVYLTIIMVIVQASLCLFNLFLTDMADTDFLKFNRQSPFSSVVFGIKALFTKPAQSLAPMVILSKLNQHGYREPNDRVLLDLQDIMFSLICVVPLCIAAMQVLTWTSFSMRNRTDYTAPVGLPCSHCTNPSGNVIFFFWIITLGYVKAPDRHITHIGGTVGLVIFSYHRGVSKYEEDPRLNYKTSLNDISVAIFKKPNSFLQKRKKVPSNFQLFVLLICNSGGSQRGEETARLLEWIEEAGTGIPSSMKKPIRFAFLH